MHLSTPALSTLCPALGNLVYFLGIWKTVARFFFLQYYCLWSRWSSRTYESTLTMGTDIPLPQSRKGKEEMSATRKWEGNETWWLNIITYHWPELYIYAYFFYAYSTRYAMQQLNCCYLYHSTVNDRRVSFSFCAGLRRKSFCSWSSRKLQLASKI